VHRKKQYSFEEAEEIVEKEEQKRSLIRTPIDRVKREQRSRYVLDGSAARWFVIATSLHFVSEYHKESTFTVQALFVSPPWPPL
jgi:hypothetical protein